MVSFSWARFAATLPEDRLADFRDRYMTLHSKLNAQTPWRIDDASLVSLELGDLPEYRWSDGGSLEAPQRQVRSGNIGFSDQATQRGLIHTCEVAPEAETEGHWIYQSVGGGIGVIDYDLDGWPDVAAAMLDGTPLQDDSSPNRLFRNRV